MASLLTMGLTADEIDTAIATWHRVDVSVNEFCRMSPELSGRYLDGDGCTYFENELDAMYSELTREKL